jgi:hypothetical protein
VQNRQQLKVFHKTPGIGIVVLWLLNVCGFAAAQPVAETYSVSRKATNGFTLISDLKEDVLREANAQCAAKKRVIQVAAMAETKPPFIFGNAPKVDLQFRCVEPNEPNSSNSGKQPRK